MPKNRLQLNFQLETAKDRAEFVQSYLDSIDFVPNERELETISNYILWGKNTSGRNVQQEGLIELKKWSPTTAESLEALIDSPNFSEYNLRTLREPASRTPRIVFDRKKALQEAPSYLKPLYEDLFEQIDIIELELNYYELFTGKRKLPPREQLINKFTEEEQLILNEKAIKLSQYKYLKLKHQLVELRQQQYLYFDSYQSHIIPHYVNLRPVISEERIYIGEDITVYPAGLRGTDEFSQKVFGDPEPSIFTGQDLFKLTDLLWKQQSENFIDFTDTNHLVKLYAYKRDLEDAVVEGSDKIYGAAAPLLHTLEYYEEKANLTPLQKDLLEHKLDNWSNLQIARDLNQKYGKTYNENYISTLYHQKVMRAIATAAENHREILENIFYPENFKRCKDCGRVLLLNSMNFIKQKKSSDGFAPRCKACEKIKRSKYKNEAHR